MTSLKLPLVIAATAASVAVVVAATTVHAAGTATQIATPTSGALALQSNFISVVKQVLPSVVQIETPSGLGSGIIFDTKGDIVTNAHVVGTSTSFTVTTNTATGAKRVPGTLVGTFVQDDLAVIKIAPGGLRPASFADSSKLRVGDISMAIGNPLGLSSSVTEGIVSALGRSQTESNGVTLVNTIQTSAAINPGNSGGALVDLYGRVTGIPTLAAVDQSLGTTAAGIGFAIPSNVVKDIASQIIKNGHVVNSHRAYLGVTIADTTSGAGVYVSAVTAGGPANKAGINVGDVITAINGSPTLTSTSLGTVVGALAPGKTVTVTLTRQAGGTATLKLKLGEFPGSTS